MTPESGIQMWYCRPGDLPVPVVVSREVPGGYVFLDPDTGVPSFLPRSQLFATRESAYRVAIAYREERVVQSRKNLVASEDALRRAIELSQILEEPRR